MDNRLKQFKIEQILKLTEIIQNRIDNAQIQSQGCSIGSYTFEKRIYYPPTLLVSELGIEPRTQERVDQACLPHAILISCTTVPVKL